MPLPSDASVKDIIDNLQELTGINQKAELAAVVANKGVSTSPSDSVAQLVGKVGQIEKGAVISRIQSGIVNMVGMNTTLIDVDVTKFDPTKSFIKIQYTNKNGATFYSGVPTVESILSNTKLRFRRTSNSTNSDLTIVWELVEFLEGVKVQSGSISMATGVLNQHVTIGSVNPDRCIVFLSTRPNANNESGYFDLIPIGQVITPVTLSITRGRASTQGSQTVNWQVVEFS